MCSKSFGISPPLAAKLEVTQIAALQRLHPKDAEACAEAMMYRWACTKGKAKATIEEVCRLVSEVGITLPKDVHQ